MFENWVWAVPLAIAGVGMWRARWGLYLFVATLPFFGFSPGGPYLEAVTVGAIIVIGLAVFRGCEPSSQYWAGAVAGGVWLLVAIVSLWPFPRIPASGWRSWLSIFDNFSYLHGQEPTYGWSVLFNLVLGLSLAWAVLRLVPRQKLIELAGAIAVGVATTLALGFLHRIGWIDLGLFRPSPRPLDDPRMQSVLVDSRRFAEYLVLAWPFSFAWSATRRRFSLWSVGFLVSLLIGLAWSLQRGAWITVAVQFLALAILCRSQLRRSWIVVVAALLAAALIVIAIPAVRVPLTDRATSLDDSSRVHLFAVSIDLFRQRPILGWGVGSFARAYTLTAPDHGGAIRGADSAHSLPGQILAERGSIGSLAFLLVLGVLALRRHPRDKDNNLTWVLTAIAVSGLGFLAYGVFQYLPYLKILEWLLWIVAGAWIAATDSSRAEQRISLWGGTALVVAALAALPFQQAKPWQQNPSWGFYGWEGFRPRKESPRAGVPGQRRWISNYAAVSMPRRGDWLSFSMVDGHPQARDHASSVQVWVNGDKVLDQSIPNSWSLCRIPVADGGDEVLVEFEVDPVFRPFNGADPLGDPPTRSRDARRLGMVLRNDCGSDLCWDLLRGERRATRAGTPDVAACYPDPKPKKRNKTKANSPKKTR